MRHADWETLLTRPGHALIAAEVGVSERTVATMVDVAHELGYLCTTEVGTTPRIREGRTRGHDPHRGEGNRAQEYRLCVPASTLEEAAGQTDDRRNFYPSRSVRRTELGTPASRLRQPAGGYARARVQQREAPDPGRPAAGKPNTPPPRPTRRPGQRPAWLDRVTEVTAVWQTLPAELVELLAGHETDRLAAEIARQLEHRTVTELAERIARHWDYWRYKLVAGLVRQPVAIAFRLVRRDFDDCPEIRCEDRWNIDQDQPCHHCTMIGTTIIDNRRAALSAPQTTASPPLAENPDQQRSPDRSRPHTATPKAVRPALPHQQTASHAANARAMLAAHSPGARKIIAKNKNRRSS